MIKIQHSCVLEQIKFEHFPNNETKVCTEPLNRLLFYEDPVTLHFRWAKNEDLIHLYFVLSHLKSLKKTLYIYYLPYSKMDSSQNGSCFTLEHIKSMFASCLSTEDKVFILEPHSDVSLGWMKEDGRKLNVSRFNVITPLAKHIIKKDNIDVICYPDKEAKEKFQDDKIDLPVIYCNKVRDFDTGKIQGIELAETDLDLRGKNILILDDLCSKGGTFLLIGKMLKTQYQVAHISLGVCHLEESIKDGNIIRDKYTVTNNSPIKNIYTLDTLLNESQKDLLTSFAENLMIYSTEALIMEKKLKDVYVF